MTSNQNKVTTFFWFLATGLWLLQNMEFKTPHTLQEAYELRDRYQSYKVLAGGTDLYVLINGGLIKPEGVISLWGLQELSHIKDSGDYIYVGSLVTHTNIVNSDTIRINLPALAEASSTIGARQIQNRGTIGGNIMNASPAGDTLPPLMAYDAEIEVSSVDGSRWIKFTDFYSGYRKSVLRPNEILTRIKIKKPHPYEVSKFLKIGTRKAQAISKIMGAFRIKIEGSAAPATQDEFARRGGRGTCASAECVTVQSVAIAYGSVAPVPIRTPKTEGLLRGRALNKGLITQAVDSVKNEVAPIDDIRSTGEYRRHVAGVLLQRFLEGL